MLKTEQRNEHTTHIDKMTALEMAEVMQQENINAALAVGKVLPAIADAIDRVSEGIKKGGRLFYVGCGTSGRLGVLDASECPPTYGVPKEMVVGLIAGGEPALRNAIEGVEDDAVAGRGDLEAFGIGPCDTVVGLSVAGNATYVVSALEYAKEMGSATVGITCNDDSLTARIADIPIVLDTGAEVVTGSTRMKAGSAQKMVLNMISTGAMIKYGRVYENFMVHIKPVNIKLKDRMIRIVCEIANVDRAEAEARLERNDWKIIPAVEE